MTEISRRQKENSRRNPEMSRVEAIRLEMAQAIKVIGESGRCAAEENIIAARLSGLSLSVIERLRWKKIKRVPADVSDAIREALDACEERSRARAKHDQGILNQRLQALARLADSPHDPDFYRGQVACVVEQARELGLLDRTGTETKGD